ncbi:tyrosine aminotransferase [Strongylocentrotus purpuratus]|uniref:Tyrosine aminotransferase n=1 Tax=Strongylocentrotus purpuratus TaxID=7668 RepID=A0A7M7TH59_STRPU|nr:tyrosine aminotransferase [Strongylocentrotus purpuratus]XP_796747.4 tyrosine aminotransferase [Strongylocentrotus purpuratus]
MENGFHKKPRWDTRASEASLRTINPIRGIVDGMKLEPNPDKDIIALSIGDPTKFGNLDPSEDVVDAVNVSLKSGKSNGYSPSVGFVDARAAVAKKYSHPDAPLTSEDVILTCGCSGALDLAIGVLADAGQNILVPRPGFALYATLAGSYDIEYRFYELMPCKSWEVDLENLESQIDEKTACIIVNNPSNPCGSVFSKEHIQDIIKIASKHHLPIVSDEVYADMVFSGSTFYSVASLASNVPVLTCGGLAKRYLAPGWRLGWILIHDPVGAFEEEVRLGLFRLSTKILGPCTLIQSALPAILEKTSNSFHENTMDILKTNAEICFKFLDATPGLKPIMPKGSMYIMCGIEIDKFHGFMDDMEFVQCLMSEESVFCLPGKCFEYPNYFRVVLCVPEEKTSEACKRIKEFCTRHYRGGLINTVEET